MMITSWPDSGIGSFESSVPPSAVYIGKLFVYQFLALLKPLIIFYFCEIMPKVFYFTCSFQNIDFVTDIWPLYSLYFLFQMIVFHCNIDFIATYFFAKNDITDY